MPESGQRRFASLDPASREPPVVTVSGRLDADAVPHIDRHAQDMREERYAAMLTQDGSYSGLRKCGKPDCFRQVKTSVAYCCLPCSTAAAGRYEIHEHSDGCEQRHAQRGPWLTSVQAMEKLIDEAAARRREQPGYGREFGAIGGEVVRDQHAIEA